MSDPTEAVIDPVCGMTVDPATTPHHFEHDGATYHFCGARCRERFSTDPAGWLDGSARARAEAEKAAQAGPGTQYTCPMHPEIVQ